MRARLVLPFLIAAVAAAALPQPADGATIQLTILSQPYVSAEGVHVYLDVRNNGDAPAFNVTPIVSFRGTESIGRFVPRLAPSTSTLQTVLVPMARASALRGVWPIFVHLSYADSNNHPFEALHVIPMPFGDTSQAAGTLEPPLKLDLSGARLTTTGTITARLHSKVSTDVSLTFLVPSGLAVTPVETAVFVKPGTRSMTAFVTNAGATESSRLPAFAIAEYEAGDRHHTAIASSVVEIARSEEGSWGQAVLLAMLAALLTAAVIGIFITRARRR